jgi:multidrug efflux pump subunit AcrA (membrane-fusion protein)
VGEDNRVAIAKVETGRREGDRIEITQGLRPEETVVESGVGFLTDGDLVAVSQGIK